MVPTKTILLIEEDPGLRSVFRDLLEKLDHWVIASPRSSGAARIFEVAGMADLVVADVTVPDSKSVSLTGELLARRPDLGAVLISTDDSEFEVRRRFSDHRTRFLLKPFSVDELHRAVADALALAVDRAPAAGARLRRAGAGRGEGPARFRRDAAALALASAAVLALVAGVLTRGPEPPAMPAAEPPPLPEAVGGTVMRGSVLKVVEPLGDQREVPGRLRWERVAGAAGYQTRILAVDDAELWQGSSPVASMTLPPEAREAILPGVVYFWTVEALDMDGRVVARSGAARFQVVPARGAEKGE